MDKSPLLYPSPPWRSYIQTMIGLLYDTTALKSFSTLFRFTAPPWVMIDGGWHARALWSRSRLTYTYCWIGFSVDHAGVNETGTKLNPFWMCTKWFFKKLSILHKHTKDQTTNNYVYSHAHEWLYRWYQSHPLLPCSLDIIKYGLASPKIGIFKYFSGWWRELRSNACWLYLFPPYKSNAKGKFRFVLKPSWG